MELYWMCSAKDRYTLIEQSSNSRITCMQYSQKNFMRIIGNDQKNNGQNFWEILERIIGKISSIIGAGLIWLLHMPKTIICKMLRYSSLLAHLFQHTYAVFKMYLPTGVLVNHGFDKLDGISGSGLK